VDGLEQQFSEQIAVQRINAEVGNGPEIMKAYRIPGHPVIMLIDPAGNETRRLIGPQTKEALVEELQQILN
jgi:hypothetical protein